VADGRAALGWLSAAWHGHPSRRLALAGVTGTDGKSTTANLLFTILRAAGRSAGLISTVNAVIGSRSYDTGLHTTTPDAPEVQQYLAEMVSAGTEVAVLEATSHGLAQHRVTACAFDVAVVTNITHEHLDFHGSYEAYREAKAMLFRLLMAGPRKPGVPKTRVLNADDSSFEYLAGIPAERTVIYRVGDGPAARLVEAAGPPVSLTLLTARDVRAAPAAMTFEMELRTGDGGAAAQRWPVTTSLTGDYNVANILAASGAALALGVSPAAIAEGVRELRGVVGRMERIDRGQGFAAIVDFAHTPNALAAALRAARQLAGRGRVIVVFGSAGLRDRAKRRMMGTAAAERADLTVVTAEDPRTEALESIMAETAAALLEAGKQEGRDFVRIPDRQRAILFAVQQAQPGDVVIVCGKGHEQSMCFDQVEHPWRDQDALAWALETLGGAAGAPPFILPTWME